MNLFKRLIALGFVRQAKPPLITEEEIENARKRRAMLARSWARLEAEIQEHNERVAKLKAHQEHLRALRKKARHAKPSRRAPVTITPNLRPRI